MNYKIYNTNRSVGAMFSGYLAKIYGHEGLKENSIIINLRVRQDNLLELLLVMVLH